MGALAIDDTRILSLPVDVERTFVSLDREALTDATRRLGHSLLGLALGAGVLAVGALVSGAFSAPAPVPAAATPIVGPILGGAILPASVPSAVPAAVTVAVPTSIAAVPAPPAITVPAPAAAGPDAAAPAAPAPAVAARVSKVTLEAYRNGGRRYTGVSAEVGTAILAPRAATVQVRTYQLLDGDVRIGTNVPSLPFFSYVMLTTADGKLTYRPGALRSDTELLVEDGDEVAAGTPLFRVVGTGASSWGTFYDATVTYNVVVSLVAIPGGEDLDAAPLIAAR